MLSCYIWGVEIMVNFYLWFIVFPLVYDDYVLAVKLERKCVIKNEKKKKNTWISEKESI